MATSSFTIEIEGSPKFQLTLVATFSKHVGFNCDKNKYIIIACRKDNLSITSKRLNTKQVQREKKEVCRTSVTFIIGRSLIEVLFFPDLKQ